VCRSADELAARAGRRRRAIEGLGLARSRGESPREHQQHRSARQLHQQTLVGQVALPEPDPERWREQLRQMLRDLYVVLVSHRDAALAGLGRVATSPQALAATETLVAVLRCGGLSDRVIGLGIDQLILYVSASAFEAGMLERSGMTTDQIERYYADVHAFYDRLPPDRFPALARVAPAMTGHGEEERFEFGLDLLIAGMETVGRSE
jgi:tetracycline repressor-like protein